MRPTRALYRPEWVERGTEGAVRAGAPCHPRGGEHAPRWPRAVQDEHWPGDQPQLRTSPWSRLSLQGLSTAMCPLAAPAPARAGGERARGGAWCLEGREAESEGSRLSGVKGKHTMVKLVFVVALLTACAGVVTARRLDQRASASAKLTHGGAHAAAAAPSLLTRNGRGDTFTSDSLCFTLSYPFLLPGSVIKVRRVWPFPHWCAGYAH